MTVSMVVAVTDDKWFEHLRRIENLAEVNFWSPSSRNFRALSEGELFLFKLHAPRNFIVGGGVFAHSTIDLPCSMAWKFFGQANGTETEEDLRALVAGHRADRGADGSDFRIGCRILTQPFFFEESDWMPVPASFKRNIVSFKRYDTGDFEGRKLWEDVCERIARVRGFEDLARYGAPQVILPRLGQGAFRTKIADIYGRRCAVTEERTLPALEAAHIRPYADGGRHDPSNGLLLRSDVHHLFDTGYVTVTKDLKFEVSGRIREEFGNGKHYYALRGRPIQRPGNPDWRPDPEALEWHNDHRFIA